ncbi:phospholipid-binding protein MlaC [uncultured Oxalicibacterium sp.]|uniref:MlaC/ttg2D family ABC transporter substrate-binding protein n=1 Tax=uncultured Oxalicibacterium sp. TaxID=1168540 RepID=UPI0025CEA016|nr:ABC transporter substrate-binding protein [uncultured Oxalicibacterium sp.]
MNQFLKKLSFAFVALSFAGFASAAVEAPDALVKRLSEEILATAKSDKQIQAGSQTRIQQVVDEKIIPHVDFQRTTALAVGRSWRQATPEQKTQLTDEFKKLLTFTYTGAISQVTNQKFEYLPFRAAADDKDVVVNTRVVQPRGEPVQLSYRLIKSDSGWKIYDINVLGAWLIESYKGSFATEINKSGIDGLIASLKDRNAKLAANVAKSGGKAVTSPSKAEEIAK